MCKFPGFFFHLKDEGFNFAINGGNQTYHGTLIFFSGDNLGAQYIRGYKEGSQAHRRCRYCMGSEEEIQNHVSYCNIIAQYYIYAKVSSPADNLFLIMYM